MGQHRFYPFGKAYRIGKARSVWAQSGRGIDDRNFRVWARSEKFELCFSTFGGGMAELPDYINRALETIGNPSPGVIHVTVSHDDLCHIWQGKPCSCTPNVAVADGKRAGRTAQRRRAPRHNRRRLG